MFAYSLRWDGFSALVSVDTATHYKAATASDRLDQSREDAQGKRRGQAVRPSERVSDGRATRSMDATTGVSV
ncbi:hypothetical protein ACW4TU_42125 [Streptomyces sp. QTS52]